MKGLIIAGLIIGALIAVGVGSSVIISNKLNDQRNAAYERGDEEGRRQGYLAGSQAGTGDGFQAGSRVGSQNDNQIDIITNMDIAINNETGFYFVYNPTYAEVRAMLTGSGESSAKGIHDYAEAIGMRTAYVRCPIARPAAEGMLYLYELVAFETVDKGLIIIEPGAKREVTVAVGRRYSELNGFSLPDYDDTISKVTIVW